jgi:hypothetical protein
VCEVKRSGAGGTPTSSAGGGVGVGVRRARYWTNPASAPIVTTSANALLPVNTLTIRQSNGSNTVEFSYEQGNRIVCCQ